MAVASWTALKCCTDSSYKDLSELDWIGEVETVSLTGKKKKTHWNDEVSGGRYHIVAGKPTIFISGSLFYYVRVFFVFFVCAGRHSVKCALSSGYVSMTYLMNGKPISLEQIILNRMVIS